MSKVDASNRGHEPVEVETTVEKTVEQSLQPQSRGVSSESKAKNKWLDFDNSPVLNGLKEGLKKSGRWIGTKFKDFGHDFKQGAQGFGTKFSENYTERQRSKKIDKALNALGKNGVEVQGVEDIGMMKGNVQNYIRDNISIVENMSADEVRALHAQLSENKDKKFDLDLNMSIHNCDTANSIAKSTPKDVVRSVVNNVAEQSSQSQNQKVSSESKAKNKWLDFDNSPVLKGLEKSGKFLGTKLRDFGKDLKQGAKGFGRNFTESYTDRQHGKKVEKALNTLNKNGVEIQGMEDVNAMRKDIQSYLLEQMSIVKAMPADEARSLHNQLIDETPQSLTQQSAKQQSSQKSSSEQKAPFVQQDTSPQVRVYIDPDEVSFADKCAALDKTRASLQEVCDAISNAVKNNDADRVSEIYNAVKLSQFDDFDKNVRIDEPISKSADKSANKNVTVSKKEVPEIVDQNTRDYEEYFGF